MLVADAAAVGYEGTTNQYYDFACTTRTCVTANLFSNSRNHPYLRESSISSTKKQALPNWQYQDQRILITRQEEQYLQLQLAHRQQEEPLLEAAGKILAADVDDQDMQPHEQLNQSHTNIQIEHHMSVQRHNNGWGFF